MRIEIRFCVSRVKSVCLWIKAVDSMRFEKRFCVSKVKSVRFPMKAIDPMRFEIRFCVSRVESFADSIITFMFFFSTLPNPLEAISCNK